MASRPDRGAGAVRRAAAAIVCLVALSVAAAAQPPDCEALAEQAALRLGIPPGLMRAVARVESGRSAGGTFRAWPWTLNQGGDGSFHDSRAAAAAALDGLLAQGVTNVDIGCMQLNWRWHGHAFPDASAMLDPGRNTAYAARFLASLFAETGDWTEAVARYHSRDPGRGAAYAARVAGMAEGTGASPPTGHRAAGPGSQLLGLLLRPGAPLVGRGPGFDLRRRPIGATGPAEG
jgi:soluble lytic murein transglycosylase-like protein